MKSVKWFYVGVMAIALGMLTFVTVACHDDDDDPKPLEGEVIETMVSSLLQKVLQVLIVLKRLLMDIFHRKRQLSLQRMQRIVVW